MGIRAVYPSSALTRRSGDMPFYTESLHKAEAVWTRLTKIMTYRPSKSQLFSIHAKCTTISGRFAGNWTFEAFH